MAVQLYTSNMGAYNWWIGYYTARQEPWEDPDYGRNWRDANGMVLPTLYMYLLFLNVTICALCTVGSLGLDRAISNSIPLDNGRVMTYKSSMKDNRTSTKEFKEDPLLFSAKY